MKLISRLKMRREFERLFSHTLAEIKVFRKSLVCKVYRLSFYKSDGRAVSAVVILTAVFALAWAAKNGAEAGCILIGNGWSNPMLPIGVRSKPMRTAHQGKTTLQCRLAGSFIDRQVAG